MMRRMTRAGCRHSVVKQRPQGLVVGVLLLLIPWGAAEAQQAGTPPEDPAGDVWRLVRGGGGVTSARGKSGVALQSVASNGEIFVAVGEQGAFARSNDGNHWTSFSPASEWLQLTAVVWGGGRFVAVGDATIMSSNDGHRWEQSTTRSMGPWNSVAWGNDRFVAVGADGNIAQSRDSRRWQRVRQATRGSLGGITWGGGRFVAVGDDGAVVHSDDGEHWQKSRDTGTSAPLYDVAWNGERYVAVGEGVILHSGNGKFWDAADSGLPPPERLHDVVWTGQRFVAVGDRLLFSSDGDRWQTATAQVGGETIEASQLVIGPAGDLRITDWSIYLRGVVHNGAALVAVGKGGVILVSSDGTHWEQASDSGDPLPELAGVAWGGGRFVAVSGTYPYSILHSPDGQRWQHASAVSDTCCLNDVVWAGDRFVAVGRRIASSAHGVRWREAPASLAGYLSAVAWSGKALVAVGEGGTIMRSNDGERWTTVADSATAEELRDVVWSGKRFVAVGAHGAIVHSRDGNHWRPVHRPAVPVRVAHADDPDWPRYGFNGIAWSGKRFVAVGWGGNDRVGAVVHSRDGDRWELTSDHDYLADENFTAVAWNGRRFVAVSYDGTIMYSDDGDRWEPASETATFDPLRDIAWGDGRFVAVGWNGTIVVSP